jgi:hypothetical protein
VREDQVASLAIVVVSVEASDIATQPRLARLPGDDEISELGGVAGVR